MKPRTTKKKVIGKILKISYDYLYTNLKYYTYYIADTNCLYSNFLRVGRGRKKFRNFENSIMVITAF